MADEKEVEVFRTLREEQRKYTYFLLAAAGTAIGLAINQTHTLAIAWSQLPLAISVLCWGLSFFFGCRNLAYVCSNLFANAELLRVESGRHPNFGNHPQMIEAASKGIREAFDSNSEKANKFGHLQFRFLIAGGIFYIFWHVIEMFLRVHYVN